MPPLEGVEVATSRRLGGSAACDVSVCLGRDLGFGLLLEQLEIGGLRPCATEAADVNLAQIAGLKGVARAWSASVSCVPLQGLSGNSPLGQTWRVAMGSVDEQKGNGEDEAMLAEMCQGREGART